MDYDKAEKRIHQFIERKLEDTGAEGFVIGISGGLDSAVTTKLAVDAVGPENVTGWILPGAPSSDENMEDARKFAEELGIEYRNVSIEPVVEAFDRTVPFEPSKLTDGNLRARIRMVYTYMDANQNDLLVLGAGNKTEIKIGYFTKYGDGAADIKPIADLYKTEVRELAGKIGVPGKIIEKKPTAGLWEGQTDEGELGQSYQNIDGILKRFIEKDMEPGEIAEDTGIARDEVERFIQMMANSEHKRRRPDYPELRKFDTELL